jgi:hypothetical protein
VWAGLTLAEGCRALQEVPDSNVSGLMLTIMAMRVEWLLAVHIQGQSHGELLNGQALLGDVDAQLAGEQCAGTRGGLSVKDQGRRLDDGIELGRHVVGNGFRGAFGRWEQGESLVRVRHDVGDSVVGGGVGGVGFGTVNSGTAVRGTSQGLLGFLGEMEIK